MAPPGQGSGKSVEDGIAKHTPTLKERSLLTMFTQACLRGLDIGGIWSPGLKKSESPIFENKTDMAIDSASERYRKHLR
jgi:hypothetical protein